MVLHKNLVETRVILSTGPISVIRAFFDYNGLDTLEECFRLLIDRSSDSAVSTRSDEKEMASLYELVRTVRVLLNTEVSLCNALSSPHATFTIGRHACRSDSSKSWKARRSSITSLVALTIP
jgi:hypothetical protein